MAFNKGDKSDCSDLFRHDAFMYYESMGSAGYVSHLRIDQKSVTLRNAVFNAAAL